MRPRNLLVLAVPLVITHLAPCQHDPADLLPKADTYAVVRFAGLAACRQATEDFGPARLVQGLLGENGRARIDQWAADQASHVGPQVHEALASVGLDIAELRALLQGPVVVGIGRPTLFADAVLPSFAVILDAGEQSQAARRALAGIAEQLQRSGPNVQASRRTLHGVEVTVLQPERATGAVCLAMAGNHLVCTNSLGYMESCLAARQQPRLNGDRGTSGRDASGLPQNTLLQASLDLSRAWNAVEPFVPFEVRSIASDLGFDGLEGLSLAIGTEGQGSCEVLHFGLRSQPGSTLQSLLGNPLTHEAAAWCPPETLLYLSMSIDAKACIESVRRLHGRLQPALQRELAREVGREVERELRHLDLNLDQLGELLGLVGPEITFAATTPGTRSLVPDVFGFVQVRDPDAVRRLIARVQGDGSGPLKTTRHEDREIWYASLVVAGNRLPIAPAATLIDGKLVLCSQLRSLRKLLATRTAQAASLGADARFQAAVASAGPTTLFCNLRVGPTLDLLWASVLPMAEAFLRGHPELGLEPEQLPTPEQLVAAIEDSTATLSVTPDGIRLRQRACFGFGAALGIAGAALDHALLELLPKARTY